MAIEPLTDSELDARIDAVSFNVPFTLNETGDPPLEFTFRFETSAQSDFPFGSVSGITAWSTAEKNAVREALARYEEVVNVDFVEDNGSGDADFSFYNANNVGGFAGFGGYGYSTRNGQLNEWDGHVALLASIDLTQDRNMSLILHEIGHAMSLKHPGNYDSHADGPFLPAAEESELYTVMSYNSSPTGSDAPTELMLYDVAALQARFGANMSHRTGKDTYGAPVGDEVDLIWDAGGKDTINWDGAAGVVIDLREGGFSSLGETDNLVVAYGVKIEIGDGGSGDDTIIAGAGKQTLIGRAGLDDLSGGKGKDILEGRGGGDMLRGGSGADEIYGGAGKDTVYGGGGGDMIMAGSKGDVIHGEGGDDIFAFEAGDGMDRIADFRIGDDKIQLDHIASFGALDIRESGSATIIVLGGGDQIKLTGVDAADLSASDFLLGG